MLFLNIIDYAKLVVKQGRKAMGLNFKIARLPILMLVCYV